MSASNFFAELARGLAAAGAWTVAWIHANPWPAACIFCVLVGIGIGLWM